MTIFRYTTIVLLAASLTVGCAAAVPANVSSPTSASQEKLPDPPPAVAAGVTSFVTKFVDARTSDGVYAIPARGNQSVRGTLGEFHTVHQRDVDTYFVCVDFHDGDTTYDVDFFIDKTGDELTMAEHYLHKIDGEVVTNQAK